MKVSRNWLNRYVGITLDDDTLAGRLTMAGLEVESIDRPVGSLDGIVVGLVEEAAPHPNADRLRLCRVRTPEGAWQVVCGAPNVAAGQKVAFARPGTTVARNQKDGQPMKISAAKIRGIESHGMICSGYELGISDDRDGIVVLDAELKPGTPLTKVFKPDSVFEIGITPNRPDLLCHFGVAREISAITGKPLRAPRVTVREGGVNASRRLKVSIADRAGCRRYSARVLSGVRIGPSPAWIREQFERLGIKPINNVVDITNFVMLEYGLPLHAFDYHSIRGGRIIVRRLDEAAVFKTLDGKERTITPEMLMICDPEGPLAIAGVMGGLNSEISGKTTDVVLEAAWFNPASIRRTSKALGLSTDASQRFERGADPGVTRAALDRAAALIRESTACTIHKGILDELGGKVTPQSVSLTVRNTNDLLGVTLSSAEISAALKRIGIRQTSSPARSRSGGKTGGKKAGRGGGSHTFAIPTWRPDLTREVDLIEEVARVHGYDRIPVSGRISISIGGGAGTKVLADDVRTYLTGAGFREIVTNSMLDSAASSLGGARPVEIANPISREMSTLRSSLIPGMLSAIRYNNFRGASSIRFYEIGRVFERAPDGNPRDLSGYREEERLLLALTGTENPPSWRDSTHPVDVFTLKGEADALLRTISLDNTRFIQYPNTTALSKGYISIEHNGKAVGTLSMTSSELRSRFDIEGEVGLVDLSLEAIAAILPASHAERRYVPVPKFPPVLRDLAVVVTEELPAARIHDAIVSSGTQLLRSVTLFDLYRGSSIGEGKKSFAYSLEFGAPDRTLEQHEVNAVMASIIKHLSDSLNAGIRE